MGNQDKGQGLIEKYLAGNASDEEQRMVERFYLEQFKEARFPEAVKAAEQLKTLMWNYIEPETVLKSGKPTKYPLWKKLTGIAAAVIGVAVCVYFFTTPRHPDAPLSSRANAKDLNDIAPGGNRATLTAANGNTISLSEAKTGIVVGDNIKYADGTDIAALSSRANAKDLDPSGVGMTTIRTPKGGMYSIILQDGTKVWLNADSKLEFYSNYRNKLQRIVKLLAGEAYFEVAKDKQHPFIVECKGQRTEVLGTHFNISAYGDDVGIRTTLLEGSVRVASLSSRANAKELDPRSLGTRDGMTKGRAGMTKPRDGEAVTLRPNQQSLLTNSKIEIKEVDASQAIAWKEGRFSFQNEPLESIMQKVARWYNISVVYENQALRSIPFWGTVSRFSNVSNVLKKLEMTGEVHFRIEGRTVYVQK